MLLPPPAPKVVFPQYIRFILIYFFVYLKFCLGCMKRTLHLRGTLIFLEIYVHSKQSLYSFYLTSVTTIILSPISVLGVLLITGLSCQGQGSD